MIPGPHGPLIAVGAVAQDQVRVPPLFGPLLRAREGMQGESEQ